MLTASLSALNDISMLLFGGDDAKKERFLAEVLSYFVSKKYDDEFDHDPNELQHRYARRVLKHATKYAVHSMKADYQPSKDESSWYSREFTSKLMAKCTYFDDHDADGTVKEMRRLLYATLVRFLGLYAAYHMQTIDKHANEFPIEDRAGVIKMLEFALLGKEVRDQKSAGDQCFDTYNGARSGGSLFRATKSEKKARYDRFMAQCHRYC